MSSKRITIVFPHSIWLQLRRLQEDGKIKSIQGACISGIKRLIEKEKGNE